MAHRILSSCLLLSLLIPITKPQSDEYAFCENTGNYTQGSHYQSNLNDVLTSLTSNITLDGGFYNATSGTESNKVYGFLQCRGDVSKEACQTCGKASATDLIQKCTYQKEAKIFEDDCWLYYADYPFFSSINDSKPLILYNTQDASDPDSFKVDVGPLMAYLSSKAASNPSKFASGDLQGITGLVQCTRYLSKISCFTCLQANADAIVRCCSSKRGARAMSTNCFVRYEMYQFTSLTSPPIPDSPPPLKAPDPNGVPKNLLIAATIVGTVTAVAIIIGCWYLLTKRNRRRKLMNLGKVEAFLKECGPFGPVRYKFSDVKKLTNSFKEKIGQGGFGQVFKGKLPDGKIVAVKVLSQVKGDGNEFINEVASISRTSHVNIVSLLGFCFERHKSALIYEFMPNGSLEKFIYGEDPLKIRPHLGWQTLYEIAIGIAQGLEYLHRGCKSRIVHFDIKPHNILLDQDFHPKIADFGLSKLCHVKESTFFVTKARGTPGYIAPEVISRNIGQVSHKSDVYSYGMMMLEMVGGRKNIDIQVADSGIYYPHWIAKRIHQNEDLGLREIASLEDEENTRKMIIVSLWCVQIDPEIRPSMSRVLEMLEGSVEALELPPRPFSSSPLADAASPSTKA